MASGVSVMTLRAWQQCRHLQTSSLVLAHHAVAVTQPWGRSRLALCRPIYSCNQTRRYSMYNTPKTLEAVETAAKRSPTRLSVKELLSVGPIPSERQLIDAGAYLQKELPVRLAHRIKDMQKVPFIVGCNAQISQIYHLYLEAFVKFSEVGPIHTLADEKRFLHILTNMLQHHAHVVIMLARAVPAIREYMTEHELKDFLDHMIITRISRRVISHQQLIMHRIYHRGFTPKSDHVNGIFDLECSPARIAKGMYRQCATACKEVYGVAPTLQLDGHLDATFTYIPVHIEFILCELLKNSMMATVKLHGDSPTLPPVRLTISKGDQSVVIRVSDQGGGMEQGTFKRAFDYSFSTNTDPKAVKFSEWTPQSLQNLIGGTGFGLPMAQIYASYFRGSIDIHNLPGYGCDVFVRLGLSLDARESKFI